MIRKVFVVFLSLVAMLAFSTSAFAQNNATLAVSNNGTISETNEVVPFATKYISDHLEFCNKTNCPTSEDVPYEHWYQQDGYAGYIYLYSLIDRFDYWEIHYSGFVYSMD